MYVCNEKSAQRHKHWTLAVVRRSLKYLPLQSLGQASPWNVVFFPSVLWHCWLARKGIRPVKKLVVGLLVVMIWLEICTTYSQRCYQDQGVRDQDQTGWDRDQGGQDQDQQGRDQDQHPRQRPLVSWSGPAHTKFSFMDIWILHCIEIGLSNTKPVKSILKCQLSKWS